MFFCGYCFTQQFWVTFFHSKMKRTLLSLKMVACIKYFQYFLRFFLLFHNCERVSVSGCVFFLVYLSNNCYKYLCKYRPIPKTDRTGKTWVSKMSRFVQVCLCVCVIRKIYFLTNTCNTNMLRQSFVV